MKKKLIDRRGAGIELAMLMIVVCFSLSILLLSTTMLLHNRKIRAEHRMEQSVALEQIGQDFLSGVVAGEVGEDWLPAEDNGLADETAHCHSWQETIVTEATCTAASSKRLICDVCGSTLTETISVSDEHRRENGERVDCGLVRPIIIYSLTVYKTAENGARYEVVIADSVSEETNPEEPTNDKVILKITMLFDKVDGTYLVTEWTKNDRS